MGICTSLYSYLQRNYYIYIVYILKIHEQPYSCGYIIMVNKLALREGCHSTSCRKLNNDQKIKIFLHTNI